MDYLIVQIIICLLFAALIGGIVGWWLRKFSCHRELAALEDDYNLKLGEVEAERDAYKGQCEKLATSLAAWENQVGGGSISSVDITGGVVAEKNGVSESQEVSWPYPVEEVEGIGATYGNRLRTIKIETTEQLLELCCESSQQIVAAKHVEVEPFVVSKWVSMSDLMRIPGIRGQYAELLEVSGIASIGEMARQDSAALTAKMVNVNAEEHRTSSVPDIETVRGWIEAAKGMSSRIRSLVPT